MMKQKKKIFFRSFPAFFVINERKDFIGNEEMIIKNVIGGIREFASEKNSLLA